VPIFDRQCPACGTVRLNVLEASDPIPVRLCDQCGEPMARAWLGKSSTVIGDECDFISRNGEKEPVRFRSRSEHRRWLKAHGYRIKDDHVGAQGSDKNKHTQRWAAMDPQTLANATALVTRASTAPATGHGDEGALGLTSNEAILHYLRDRSRIERGDLF